MSLDDGRLVSNFAVAALKGEPLQIYGDGQATRSLMVGQKDYVPTRRPCGVQQLIPRVDGLVHFFCHSSSTT